MGSVVIDRRSRCVVHAPGVIEAVANVHDRSARAHVRRVHPLICGSAERHAYGIVLRGRVKVAAARGAAVGNVAVGFVVDDFALEESADSGVGQVAEFVGTHSQVGGERLSALVWYVFAD